MEQANLSYTVAELNSAIGKFFLNYADVSKVTATAADVRKGKIIVNKNKSVELGTLENVAKINGTPLTAIDPLQLDAIIKNAKHEDNGKIYKYEGESTEKYVNGEYYIINVATDQPSAIPSAPSAYLSSPTDTYPNGSIILWDSVENAKGYNVYLNNILVSSTESTFFNFSSISEPGSYYASISAYNSLGESAKSNSLLVKITSATIGGVILNVNIENGSYKVINEPIVGENVDIVINSPESMRAPLGVSVIHNGKDISENASLVSYSRTDLQGILTLYTVKDGTYIISGSCFDPNESKVEYDIYDGGITYEAEPQYGESWTCTVYAPWGYAIPESLTVKIDGVLTNSYNYSSDNGILTIEKFKGYKVYIEGVCTKLLPTSVSLAMDVTLTSLRFSWSESIYTNKYRLYALFPGASSYDIIEETNSTSFELFMTDLEVNGAYYFYVTGVNDAGEGAKSNIVSYMLSSGSQETVLISENVTNGKASYATPIVGKNAEVIFIPDDGYAPPVYVNVTKDGENVPIDNDSATYVRGMDTGILTLYNLESGTYSITAICVAE